MVACGRLKIAAGIHGRRLLVEATDAGRTRRTETQRALEDAQPALNANIGMQRVAVVHDLRFIAERLSSARQDERMVIASQQGTQTYYLFIPYRARACVTRFP